MENQCKLNNTKEVIAFLAERFPKCFSTKGAARPLKIGIFQDLVESMEGETKLSKTQLRSALRFYTSSWRYLYGIKDGVIRIDLDGNACGQLDEQHVRHARQQLKEAKARVQIQRKQQRIEKQEVAWVTVSHHLSQAHKKQGIVLSRQEAEKNNPYSSCSKFKPEKFVPVINTSALQVGQSIKVTTGQSLMVGIILEITKDGVRVQLASGLAMIVRAEHLQL